MLLPCLLMPLSAQAEEAIGKITRLRGIASIHRKTAAKPIKTWRGAPVYLNDRITTGKRSYVRIQLKDRSILTLGQKGEIVLDKFEYKPKQKRRSAFFRALLGRLRVFARDMKGFKKKDFRLRTPTAVCGVRGTLFLVHVLSSTHTIIASFDNAIEVASYLDPTKYVVATPRTITECKAGNPPTTPVLMTEEQFRELQSVLDLDTTTSEGTDGTTTQTTETTETTITTDTTETTETTEATQTTETTTTKTGETPPTTTTLPLPTTTTTTIGSTTTTTTTTTTIKQIILPPLPGPPGTPFRR